MSLLVVSDVEFLDTSFEQILCSPVTMAEHHSMAGQETLHAHPADAALFPITCKCWLIVITVRHHWKLCEACTWWQGSLEVEESQQQMACHVHLHWLSV